MSDKFFNHLKTTLADIKVAPTTKLIGMTGSGAVGKTSFGNIVINRIPRTKFVGSVSRATFKRMGYLHESDQRNMTELQKWELQQAIQTDYVENFKLVVEEANDSKDHDILVFDRLLIDHRGYSIFQNHAIMDAEAYKAQSVLCDIQAAMFHSILFFSYPPAFDMPDDGFRDQDLFKDTTVDALIYKQVAKFYPFIVPDALPMHRFYKAYLYMVITCGLTKDQNIIDEITALKIMLNRVAI